MAAEAGRGSDADGRRAMLHGVEEQVVAWLKEDVPSFDYGAGVVGDKAEVAILYGKSRGILAGCPFFDAIFAHLNCKVEWLFPEGTMVEPIPKPDPPRAVAKVTGKACDILRGERTALNVLSRASGIATCCRRLVDIKVQEKWAGHVAGTRKTTPGFRMVEKYAMLVGGADTHRVDLSSMVMLKDNHIWSQGSITKAVHKAKDLAGFALKIEVECGSEAEAEEAIAAGADIVMLDNFEPGQLKEVASRLKGKHPHVIVEGSGGIREDTIASYMCPGVDILSTSSIHQGTPILDFSLKVAH